ncbi:isoleucyl-tRNA synthetase [Paraphysoderma sedebokerense]|nr:isoleucyl-tRNA synthetase [Paraphysoderma sedebokerense]
MFPTSRSARRFKSHIDHFRLRQLRFYATSPGPRHTNSDKYHDYANTLCLPQTSFGMRPDGSKKEVYLKKTTANLYAWQANRTECNEFILHDGPPYANGELHIGHALNKILKDIISRYKLLRGHTINYVPGWDCHGLPIEMKALQESRKKDKSLTPLTHQEIRSRARKLALETVQMQKSNFQEWGIMGDWDKAYLTLDPKYESNQLKVFHQMVEKGLIYRKRKPVYWSPSSRTALAESELEYKDDHISRSLYVKFPVSISSNSTLRNIHPDAGVFALIWTTTPFTLPANKAITINPALSYSIVTVPQVSSSASSLYIVSTSLIPKLSEIFCVPLQEVAKISASELRHLEYTNLIGEKCKFLEADWVTAENGTGLVHTAPGHGMDDYQVCVDKGIEVYCPVNDAGKFHNLPPRLEFLEGQNVLDQGTDLVINYLKQNDMLLKEEKYIHKYPYDWRTKKPVILRATMQWFADLSKIKDSALNSLENVQMIPETGRRRLESFIQSRSEWCISRQRAWGVPIPVFYDRETDTPLLTSTSLSHITSIISKHGSDAWFDLPTEELLAPEYRENGNDYVKGTDTMDVWFDSGVSWMNLGHDHTGSSKVADLYLEGSDQHRGWFQSSLLTSIAVRSKAPYKAIITHGFTLDESSRKMSKSLGNIIPPSAVIHGSNQTKLKSPKLKGIGVDGLRLWVSSTDYMRDVNVGEKVLSAVGESVRKIRNTGRFMLGNLHGFNANEGSLRYAQLDPIDRYMLHELQDVTSKIESAYEEYSFNKVYHHLNNFTNLSLSSFYFGIIKDRLYADGLSSPSRRGAQTVLYHILRNYISFIAPIMPLLAEEMFEHFEPYLTSCDEQSRELGKSAFMLGWPKPNSTWNDPSLAHDFAVLKEIKSGVNQILDVVRREKLIKTNLEATVYLQISSDSALKSFLEKYEPTLRPLLHTSSVSVTSSSCFTDNASQPFQSSTVPIQINDKKEELTIHVQSSELKKCPRCWNFWSVTEGEICNRCHSVLNNSQK